MQSFTGHVRRYGLSAALRRAVDVLADMARSGRLYDIDAQLKSATIEERFEFIYRRNYWGNKETVSGAGSTIAATEATRRALERFIRENRIHSMLDAPCGDWNWMKHVRFHSKFRYYGADIVGPLINELRDRFEDKHRHFFTTNIIQDPFFDDVDLWLCRDTLFHLSFSDIRRVLLNFCRSNIPMALITHHPGADNLQDIDTGYFRPVCLTAPPFRLPMPMLEIKEQGERVLGLWTRELINASIS